VAAIRHLLDKQKKGHDRNHNPLFSFLNLAPPAGLEPATQ